MKISQENLKNYVNSDGVRHINIPDEIEKRNEIAPHTEANENVDSDS